MSAVNAQISLPETPAGTLLAGWIEAFNDADAESFERFIQASYHPEALSHASASDRARSNFEWRQNVGPLELRRVLRSAGDEIAVCTYASEIDSEIELSLRLRDGKIPGVRIAHLAPPPAARLSDAEIDGALTGYVHKLAVGGRFSGIAAVAREGNIVASVARGTADVVTGAAIGLDTQFNLASMNKTMTGVAIAQLAQRGVLSFTDTIADHLPDYPDSEVARKVSIHHLLSHTSGMGNYMTPDFFTTQLESLADYLPFFAKDALAFEPGGGWSYSNAAFLVAGMIVEKASGVDYFRYVERNIFAPAQMTRSDFHTRDEAVANRATPYTRMEGPDGERSSAQGRLPGRGGPAGGGYSSVNDLVRFAHALRTHVLLDRQHTDLITTVRSRQPEAADGCGYGYGFEVGFVAGQRGAGHAGGFPGCSTHLRIFTAGGYAAVVLANFDPPAAQLVMDWLSARMPATPDSAAS